MFHTFSFIGFRVSVFMPRFFIHLNLSFVQRKLWRSSFIPVNEFHFILVMRLFCFWLSDLTSIFFFFVKNAVISPMCPFCIFVKKQTWPCRSVNLVWMLKSISSICVSVFMPVPRYFYYYSSVVWLKIRGGKTYSNIFTVQNCFDYSVSFMFPYKSWDYFSQYLWGIA